MLAEANRRMLGRPAALSDLGWAARRGVEVAFDIAARGPLIVDIYEELFDGEFRKSHA